MGKLTSFFKKTFPEFIIEENSDDVVDEMNCFLEKTQGWKDFVITYNYDHNDSLYVFGFQFAHGGNEYAGTTRSLAKFEAQLARIKQRLEQNKIDKPVVVDFYFAN